MMIYEIFSTFGKYKIEKMTNRKEYVCQATLIAEQLFCLDFSGISTI